MKRLLFASLLLSTPALAQAAPIGEARLAWTAVNWTPPAGGSPLAGYRVCWAVASGAPCIAPNFKDIGLATSTAVSPLDCKPWFFTVYARTADGKLSQVASNEVDGAPSYNIDIATGKGVSCSLFPPAVMGLARTDVP